MNAAPRVAASRRVPTAESINPPATSPIAGSIGGGLPRTQGQGLAARFPPRHRSADMQREPRRHDMEGAIRWRRRFDNAGVAGG